MKRFAFYAMVALLVGTVAASAQYVTKIYKHDGGDQMTVASGGTVTVDSGGTLAIDGTWKIGGTTVTATAAALNTDTLTNKSIDGDDNTVTDLGPGNSKAAADGPRGSTATAGTVFAATFDMDNTAGTATWTNDLDPERSCKIIAIYGIKTDDAGTAGDTVKVSGSGGDVTAALSLNGTADGAGLVFAGHDDSKTTIAHDATITCVTVADGDHCECEVSVLCVWQ